ncbi:MAG: ABC transporter substrate-binding protein [Pseudomonadota bacterium]
MKFCPVCDRQFEAGEICPDDGTVLMNAPEEQQDPLLGVLLKNSYRIEAKIGEGGMGAVYRVTQLPLGRSVAVKVLRPDSQTSVRAIKRFYREAKTLSGLSHPNIVSLIDFGNTEEGLFYLVMEHLDGVDLYDAVCDRVPLPLDEVLRLVGQMCAGVGAAHACGLVHRDLKPSNIYVARTSDGTSLVKILDFGIAKVHDDDSVSRLTQTGSVVGTVGYIAPEVMTGEGEATPASDVYSLGAILYLVLTGKAAYDGPSTRSVILKQLSEAPELPDFKHLGYPDALRRVVLRAMSVDPAQRYLNTGDLAEAVRQAAQQPVEPVVAAPLPRSVNMADVVDLQSEVDELANTQVKLNESQLDTQTLAKAPPEVLALRDKALRSAGTPAIARDATLDSRPPAAAPGPTPAPSGPGRDTLPRHRRSAAPGAIGGLLIVGVLAALTWFAWKGGLLPGSSVEPGVPSGAGVTPVPTTVIPRQVGVTDTSIVLGMSGPFTGMSSELGLALRSGFETAFRDANDAGGVHGRRIQLTALDDGYEPDRAVANVTRLLTDDKVFAIVGSMGTPTTAKTLPLALEARVLFFGALSGADFLEKDPPDRYVFNYRARYGQEVEALVDYLVKVRHLSPRHIAVFAQDDAFGEDGLQAVRRALRRHGHPDPEGKVVVARYERNSIDVEGAVRTMLRHRSYVKAVIMLATYQPAAALVGALRARKLDPVFGCVSFVGSDALATRLVETAPAQAEGVIVTQVVPDVRSEATGVRRFRETYQRYFPDQPPTALALEGFITASIFLEALRQAGPGLSTERLIDTLETMRNLDLGTGVVCSLGPSQHQCSSKVWASVLDASGRYQDLRLD